MRKNNLFIGLIFILVLVLLFFIFYFRSHVENFEMNQAQIDDINNARNTFNAKINDLTTIQNANPGDKILSPDQHLTEEQIGMIKQAQDDFNKKIDEITGIKYNPSSVSPVTLNMGNSSVVTSPSVSSSSQGQGPGDYKFKFSINNPKYAATATGVITIDSNDTAVDVKIDGGPGGKVLLDRRADYDSWLDNKIKVIGPNKFVFSPQGKGGFYMSYLNEKISDNLFPAMGKFPYDDPRKFKWASGYRFNTDSEGNTLLSAYNGLFHTDIPSDVYTLTITKI
jgi:hypothetical protein